MEENRLGSDRIVHLVLRMSLPVMLSMAMQAIYNIADSLFISRYSEIAFGGVSIIQPLLLVATALANGIGAGTGSLLSMLLGQRNINGARKAISTGWAFSLSFGLFFSFLLFFSAKPFVYYFSSDEIATKAAISYLRIISPSIILVFISSHIAFILQSHDMPKRAMVMQLVGAIVNIILDPIFIFYLGFGAGGGAIASAIGYLCSAFLALLFYFNSGCLKAYPRFYKSEGKKIASIALPATMVQGAGPIVGVVLNNLVISYGIEVMAVYGMYLKTESFMFLASQGISSALIVIVGYNYGKGDMERVKNSFKVSLIISWSVMLIGFIVFQGFARTAISIFTDNESLIELGIPAFRSLCFCFLLTSPNIIMTGLLQGLGKGGLSLTITYTRFFLFLIPLAFILNWLFGLSGLYFCYFAADIPTVFLLIAIYRYLNKTIFLCNKTQHTVAQT